MLENKATPSLCVNIPGAVIHLLSVTTVALAQLKTSLIREYLVRQTLPGSSWVVRSISQCLAIVCEICLRMGCSGPWLDQCAVHGLAHIQSDPAHGRGWTR